MKNKIILLIFITSLVSCGDDSTLSHEENEFASLTTTIGSLENQSGIIITGDIITFTEDTTIPEGVILNFTVTNKIIVNSGVTLTINGIIIAGKFQIFEIAEGGIINGCPQIEHIVPQWWGTDDSGTINSSDLFQKAVESFPCISKLIANGKFLFDKEVLLNVNERYYDFIGGTFIGADTGTDNGGLITIGDRDFNITEEYSVENVTLVGGIYIPKFNHDNSIGVLNSKNIKILNVKIIGTEGLRGIALQNPSSGMVNNPVIENVIIENIIQDGGVNIINIDINNGLAKNIVINNIIGSSIDEINPQPHSNSKEAAFRISSQADMLRIKNLNISDVILDDIYMGFELKGVKANISNIEIYNVDYRGINIQFPDIINLNDITITSISNITDGIVGVGPSTTLSNIVNFNNTILTGKFNHGVWNFIPNVEFNQLSIAGEFTFGIHNSGENSSYHNVKISTPNDIFYHTGIYNHSSGKNSSFEGIVIGKYNYGLINSAKNCVVSFQITGIFNNEAIHTFYNSFGYSSVYKAIIHLTDGNSKHINQYRNGDIYELYVYNELTDTYVLNPI